MEQERGGIGFETLAQLLRPGLAVRRAVTSVRRSSEPSTITARVGGPGCTAPTASASGFAFQLDQFGETATVVLSSIRVTPTCRSSALNRENLRLAVAITIRHRDIAHARQGRKRARRGERTIRLLFVKRELAALGSATSKSGRPSPLTSAQTRPRRALSDLASGSTRNWPCLNSPEALPPAYG